MADAELTVSLIDRLSGPAKRVRASISKLGARISRTNKNFTSADGRLRNLQGRFVAGSKGASRFGGALGKLGSVVGTVAKGIGIVTVAAAAVGAVFAKHIGSAALFSESLQFSLTRFLGSAEEANKQIDELFETSEILGTSFEDNAKTFKTLISAGIVPAKAQALIRFKADLLALAPAGGEAQQKISNAFDQLQKSFATGRFEADAFNSILENVPTVKLAVLEELSKTTGKTMRELRDTDITKLPVKELTDAFQKATVKATGFKEAGELAAERIETTIGGATTAITNRFKNLPFRIVKAIPAVEGLGGVVRRMLDAFDSPTAHAAIAGIGEGIGSIGKFVVDNQDLIFNFAGAIVDGFKAALPAVKFLAKSIGEFFKDKEAAADFANGLRIIGNVAGFTAAAIGVVVAAVGNFFVGLVTSITHLESFLVKFGELGTAMMTGLAAGIKGAAGAVVDAVTGAVGGALEAAKRLLQPGSPSKVFMEFGLGTMQGMQRGIDAGAGGMQRSLARAVDPSDIARAVSQMSSGGGGNFSATSSPSISVNGASDPAAVAQSVSALVVSDMLDVFEQLQVEAGG